MYTVKSFNAWNVSFETIYDGQSTLSTQLIKPNYLVVLLLRRSNTVSFETYPLYSNNLTSLCKVTITREPCPLCQCGLCCASRHGHVCLGEWNKSALSMTMQETNISYIYSYPCPMEGLFIPTCCESNWLNHDFFRFKTEKKENVVDDMFLWKTSENGRKVF